MKLIIYGMTLLSLGLRCGADVFAPTDDEIRGFLKDRIEAKQAPGIVAAVIDGHGQRIVAEGKTALEGGVAVDGDTVFEIGSVSKVFTGLLLADMVQRGEVKLGDPIMRYLPASISAPSRNGKQITLLDLALHRSGLPRMPDNFTQKDPLNPYADYSFENMCAFLKGYKLTRDIGEKYEYSNLGVSLLGELLARRAGTNYEALLMERIVRPLGLGDTAITLPPRLKARFAAAYDASLKPVKPWDFDACAPAGGIRSTAKDMLKFLAANMGQATNELWPAMQSMQEPMSPTEIPNTRVGICWHISDKDGRRVIWHNGQTGGYHAFVGFDPTNKIGAVALVNAGRSIDDIGFHLIDSTRELSTAKSRAAEKIAKVDASRLDAFVGKYQLAPGIFFNLRRDGEHLLAQLTGQGYLEIFPKSETNFFYKVVDAQISFQRDAQGKVSSLTLHQNGMDQTAQKVSDEAPKERQTVKLDAKTLDKYVGEYELGPGAVFIVKREGNRLLAQLTGQDFYEIYPKSETEFFYKVVDAQISFVKGDDGKAAALTLHQNGADQKAPKTK